jgi:hypothetical protein
MERQDNGVTIRNPSTANLLVDSTDRTTASSANFTIARPNSILNGYFHRLGVAEVILNYGIPNVSAAAGNNAFTFTVGATNYPIQLTTGSFTVASLLDTLIIAMNAQGSGVTFSLTIVSSGTRAITGTGAFTIQPTLLAQELNLTPGGVAPTPATSFNVVNPNLLPYNYLDFVCNDLTYNQSLKDATTTNTVRDVLYRWYLAWDGPVPLDAYGYPINQGYVQFNARRILPFPKQIRWENNMPVGNLSFSVYANNPNIPAVYDTVIPPSLASNGRLEWAISMLVSEN